VRRKSYCTILLDEIEKAHPEVFNILLQIFDDGHLTDAKGRKVDFRNSIIVMTSNIGSDLIKRDSTLGFAMKSGDAASSDQQYNRMKDKVMDEVKRFFRPEFLNRIDSSVVFHSLTKEHIIEIVDLMLDKVREQLTEKNIELEVTQAAKERIADKGYDPDFGARPLRRVIQDEIEDMLSEELLAGRMHSGDVMVVDVEDDKFVVHPKEVAALTSG
jgi:ATP-dependent Clp protease ATP-binding subunit ClpC